MTPPTATCRPAPRASAPSFDPRAALAALDVLARRPDGDAHGAEDGIWSEAWDAAWIACTTNSPRWAETARLEFLRATAAAPHPFARSA